MGLLAAGRKLVDEARTWTWHHLVVFLLTFALYTIYHACRKAFSNIKDAMEKSLTPFNDTMYPYDTWQKNHMFLNSKDANVFLGELDFLFLTAYGVGLFASGIIGDRVNLRYFLTGGIIGSSLLTFLFGYASVPLHVDNKWFFRVLFFLNGLFQSTGWPSLVAVMGNWFNKQSSGLVFGIWSAHANVGNVVGTLLVTSVIKYGYEYGMLLNSILSFCGGVLIFICLLTHPKLAGLNYQTKTSEQEATEFECSEGQHGENNDGDDKHAIRLHEACLIPGVLPYAFSLACLRMVTYAFFFWLPTYLSQKLHWNHERSGNFSNFYDVGGILGTILCGVASDLIGSRSVIVSSMLFLSIPAIGMYKEFGHNYVSNVVLLTVCGCLLRGPASLITSVISADLGKHGKAANNRQALSTVTGIIDGTGNIGAAIGQYVIGIISKYCGWEWVFNFLLIMTFVSLLLILPILVKDFKTWRQSRIRVVHME